MQEANKVYTYLRIAASKESFRPVKLLSWKWLLSPIFVCCRAIDHHLYRILDCPIQSPARIQGVSLWLSQRSSFWSWKTLWRDRIFPITSSLECDSHISLMWAFAGWSPNFLRKFLITCTLQKMIMRSRCSDHDREGSRSWRKSPKPI